MLTRKKIQSNEYDSFGSVKDGKNARDTHMSSAEIFVSIL